MKREFLLHSSIANIICLNLQGISMLGKIRQQWGKLVQFFTIVADNADVTLTFAVKNFMDSLDGNNMCHYTTKVNKKEKKKSPFRLCFFLRISRAFQIHHDIHKFTAWDSCLLFNFRSSLKPYVKCFCIKSI